MAAKRTRSRPTRTDRILGLDGRERLALAIRDMRDGYLSQCPQPVSPVDAALCDRLAVLGGHLLQLDSRALQNGGLASSDVRTYTSLAGQHARLLKQLAARRGARPAMPSLDELFEGASA
jgi:hypothetical protein